MIRIINLLNEKNHYLEKFYSLNEQELVNFVQGQFENLEHFYETRERILSVIKYVDAQIDREHQVLGQPESISEENRRDLKQALDIKDQYVARIIEQDVQVLACMESAKNSLIKELQDVRRNRKGVNGYKVKSFQSRIDEEI